jgi:hypothetical protein
MMNPANINHPLGQICKNLRKFEIDFGELIMLAQSPTPSATAARDIIRPKSPIRLPGIAGPVMWRAEIDTEEMRLVSLLMELPNGIVDTAVFDQKTGVHVWRQQNDEPVILSPEMRRQVLIHARIISGVHLELALENMS